MLLRAVFTTEAAAAAAAASVYRLVGSCCDPGVLNSSSCGGGVDGTSNVWGAAAAAAPGACAFGGLDSALAIPRAPPLLLLRESCSVNAVEAAWGVDDGWPTEALVTEVRPPLLR